MVNVDTIYQRVLALANKEQRGYITPQEFNLYANQAQMDIFEQYFYDINQFSRIPGNDTSYSDMLNYLEEKISLFEKESTGTWYPTGMYQFGCAYYTPPGENSVLCEQINAKDVAHINSSPLLKPTRKRPVYTLGVTGINIYPSIDAANITIKYTRVPSKVNWTYIVVGDKALYNNTDVTLQHFELHTSEETKLVIKILALAGITMKDPNLYQAAAAEDLKNIQQEKS